MLNRSSAVQPSWLAFDLSVLARLDFKSVLVPFGGEPILGSALKRRGARVLTNNSSRSGWTKAVAEIQNNGKRLSETDIETVLEDVYVPGYRLKNPALRGWFGEADAWWFDNLRANAEKLASPVARAVALSVGVGVGDYVLSFTEETRELRQPLSKVFKRLAGILAEPFDNGQDNLCSNKNDADFLAENHADLLFLRLPPAHAAHFRESLGAAAWSEEWVRGASDFWNDLENAQAGRMGAAVQTKTQYLYLVEETLKTASHIPLWAIAHVEDGFLASPELAEIINGVRRVETIFTKDFSELTGAKAVIVTA